MKTAADLVVLATPPRDAVESTAPIAEATCAGRSVDREPLPLRPETRSWR